MASTPRFVAGQGSLLYDREGETYLDLIGGWGIALLGWQPQEVLRSVRETLERHAFAVDGGSPEGDTLDETLRRLLGRSCRVVPATTGSEAVDLAIRLARRFTGKPGGAVFSGAFHGNAGTALPLCGLEGWTWPVDQVGHRTLKLPFPAIAGNECAEFQQTMRLLADADDIGFLILEPLRANAGFRLPRPPAVREIADLCREREIVLIADDVSTGLGRGGYWRGCDHFGFEADITVLGKGLGGTVYPIAALLCRSEIGHLALRPGFRSSLAWSPPACAAALATLDVLEREDLPARARRLRGALSAAIDRLQGLEIVTEVTGVGLGIGIALAERNGEPPLRYRLRDSLLRARVLVGVNPVLPGLVLMPALTIGEGDLTAGLEAIAAAIEEL